MKGNKPLKTNFVLGGAYDVEQVEERPNGKLLILVLNPKMEYCHVSLGL